MGLASLELEAQRATDHVKQVFPVHLGERWLDILFVLPDPPGVEVGTGVDDSDDAVWRLVFRQRLPADHIDDIHVRPKG